ncbi:disease resistance protein TAO1 isoform X2 [Raphanus sativus]|uniref:ADP-ribosyl cyclase/cyclic ADP-ribose hydrolase n=1 Tax=Raphanus sativus TaxID=3726 RepID=A0A6J0KE72_RAPSA|nr:disease resistance protein TAO1 isoform X2 [Raphanus sativus]
MALLCPSSLPRNWIHDVFPSFHGADVRTTFLSHVLKEFKRRGIDTFIDNDIKRSKSIGPKLIEAIRGSRVAIVLLSRNYASSTWCLNELVEIAVCRREFGQTVMPIFYEVDPSDVKKQAGEFGKVFENTCNGKTEEDTMRWREALMEVATIAGEHSSNWCSEAEMIEKIAADISNVVNDSVPSNYFESLIGIGAHMERMRSLLSLECDEVRMVGIWGPAGIGKTTIARALYEKLCSNFTHTAFIESIKGGYTTHYLDNYAYMLQLQEQLLSKTLSDKDLKIGHVGVAQERLKKKKVLIVLDGVDRLVQLNAMADKPEWFGRGSRIIITTQDLKLLKAHGIDHIYKVDYPIDEEALQIFCKHAFGQNSPKDGFEELALEVTNLSGKLPLGLSIMGSYFRGMSKHEWINALPRLKSRLHDDIKSILRFSYDALCDEDKELFLYIACFFNLKSIQTLEDHLERTFLNWSHGLHILAERSLICREYGFIKMHNLLVQLGRDIVLSQSFHDPWKRQFLVDAREICQVLTYETGSESLVGMDLDLSEINKEFNISKITFKRMCNLQFLRFYRRFDDKESLVELNMRNSKLNKLWEGVRPLQNLKWMDLSHSSDLKELPDLSTATKLLSLDLSYCTSLVELHSSVGNATNLLILNIEYCNNLVEIPSSVENIPNLKIFLAGCSSLVSLPSCIWNISSLRTFNLDNFSSLVQSPLMWNAKNFQRLDLSGCSSLKKLPPIIVKDSKFSQSAEFSSFTSIKNHNKFSQSEEFSSFIASIKNLHELILSNCSSLMELPASIENATSLHTLDLSGCSSLKTLPSSAWNVKNLQKLILSICSNLVELPASIENATNLMTLDLSGCSSLVEIPPYIRYVTSLRTLDLSGCSSLVKLPFVCYAPCLMMLNVTGC